MKYLLILLLSFNCYSQSAVKLNKGDSAPFTGALIKEDRLDKLVKSEKKVIKLEQLTIKQEELNTFYKGRAESVENELKKERTKYFFKSIGYFVLGVAATSLAAYAAIRSSK